GTRRDILDDITGWIVVPSESGSVLWLSGDEGSGKSAISTMVAEYFRGVGRLGAFLFLERNDRSRSEPGAVIRTIAYSLALFNPRIGSAIADVIRRDPAVVSAPVRTQFTELLFNPLRSVEQYILGPIVVIIDALDQCGNPNSRAILLALLSDEFPKLPRFFRLFVTSRRELDITTEFES
ncbi:hypothetical protein FB451DRAFT_950763, partial [Mycena latifolia]